MKPVLRTLIVLGTLAAMTQSASAQGGVRFSFSNGYYGYNNACPDSHHRILQQRKYQRQAIHRNAHRYPMTRQQHGNLMDSLRHDAFHDRLEHRSAHRNSSYYYPYSSRSRYIYNPYGNAFGFGYSGPGFSIQLGR